MAVTVLHVPSRFHDQSEHQPLASQGPKEHKSQYASAYKRVSVVIYVLGILGMMKIDIRILNSILM